MPIELRSRLLSGSSAVGDPATHVQRRAVGYSNWSVRKSVDPASVIAAAQENEEMGFDGMLIAERSGWPDVFPISSWVLASTTRIKTVSAHRIGRQSPTTTARLVQTIDRLSGGRIVVHFITGHNEQDQRRDGDFLSKADRYRRALEFLEVYTLECTATEPFDFEGEFYQVKDGLSGVGSFAQPYPEISWAGSSPAALEIAAKYADTFSLSAERLDGTLEVTSQVAALAAEQGRTLRFWHNGNQILGRTDAEARTTAEAVSDVLEGPASPLQLDIKTPESVSRRRLMAQAAEGDWAEHSLYMRTARITGGESVPAFVGTPETVAEGMLAFYEQGIEIFGMDPLCYTEEEVVLKKELLRLLHEGAREIDARRAGAAPALALADGRAS